MSKFLGPDLRLAVRGRRRADDRARAGQAVAWRAVGEPRPAGAGARALVGSVQRTAAGAGGGHLCRAPARAPGCARPGRVLRRTAARASTSGFPCARKRRPCSSLQRADGRLLPASVFVFAAGRRYASPRQRCLSIEPRSWQLILQLHCDHRLQLRRDPDAQLPTPTPKRSRVGDVGSWKLGVRMIAVGQIQEIHSLAVRSSR